ncbi:MAG: DMT family transporter [Anaerolineales bacterium]|nr:DMT family transporter [Anaerolineales bacterium]
MKPTKTTYLLLVLVTSIWGNSFIAIKHAVQFLTPIELTILRFIPVALIFGILLLTTRRAAFWQMVRRDWLGLVLLGLSGAVAYNLALNTGESRIPAGTASLIISLNPAFTFILSALFLRERPTIKKAMGLAIAFLGLYAMVRYASNQQIDFSYLRYVFITMLAPLCWAIYTILGKPLVARYPPLLVVGGAMIAAVIPLLFLIRGSLIAKLPTLPPSVWLSVAFLSLACTVFAFVIWFWALQRMEASRAAGFVYLVPLFGVSFSKLLLDEPITLALLIGAALLIGGIYLINLD